MRPTVHIESFPEFWTKEDKTRYNMKVRRKYKIQLKWLRGAIADTESLNLSQLRVQLPS